MLIVANSVTKMLSHRGDTKLLWETWRQLLEVELVSRLRLDAQLYGFPAPQDKSKLGLKPKKGARLPSQDTLSKEPQVVWCAAHCPIRPYAGKG